MKTKFMRIGKRSLSIALSLMMVLSTMIVGTVPVSAYNNGQAYIYFDNTNTNWSGDIYYAVGNNKSGNDEYTSVYQMKALTGTKLYYLDAPAWSDAAYMAFYTSSSSWSSGKWSYSNISDHATNYTASIAYQLNSGNTYLFTPAGSSNGTNLSGDYKAGGYNDLNKSITVSSQKSDNGTDWTSCSTGASLSSTAKLTGNGTVSTSTSTAALTATVTLNYGSLAGYKFDHWVDGSGNTVKSPVIIGASSPTIYKACFLLDKEPCASSVTLSATPTSLDLEGGASKTATLTTTVTSPKAGATLTYSYACDKASGWSITSGSGTAQPTVTFTSTGTYKFTVTVSDSTGTYGSKTSNEVTVTVTDSAAQDFVLYRYEGIGNAGSGTDLTPSTYKNVNSSATLHQYKDEDAKSSETEGKWFKSNGIYSLRIEDSDKISSGARQFYNLYNSTTGKWITTYVESEVSANSGNYDSWNKQFTTNTTTTYYVNYNPKKQEITITLDPPTGTETIKVYPKNGIPNGSAGWGSTKVYSYDVDTNEMGTSSLTKNSSGYVKVETGKSIVVKTTVNTTQANQGYYVDSFVVNGVSYAVDTANSSGSVYCSVPIEVTEELEITPVYYNTKFDYITVYVDASSAKDDWGNSVNAYTWYHNGGAEMNGAYPGQPLGKTSSGLYVGKIPRYAYTFNASGEATKGGLVKGITVGNGHENDSIHDKFLTSEQRFNLQTYDYDDFELLAEMGFDSVKVELKYHDGNGSSGHSTTSSGYTNTNTNNFAGNDYTADGAPASGKDYRDVVNEYEELYNFDGNAISVIGLTSKNIKDDTSNSYTALKLKDGSNLLGALDTSKAAIKIVSVGNKHTSFGTWGTVWYVYDTTTGTLITQGSPSDFIPRGTVTNGVFTASTTQSTAYNAVKNYTINGISAAYYAAAISYESEQNSQHSSNTSGQTGIRSDARWLYATSNDKFPAKVQIMYADGSVNLYKADGTLNSTVANSKNTWTKDTYTGDSVTGNVTNASASMKYTDKESTVQGPAREFAEVNRNTKVSVVTSTAPKASYKFVGWYKPVYEESVDTEKNEVNKILTGYEPADKSKQVDYTIGGDLELYAMYVPVAGLYVKSGVYSPKTATELDSNNWILEGVETDKKTGTTTGAKAYATFNGSDAREFVEDESDVTAFTPGSTVALYADNSVPSTGLNLNGKRYEFAGWYKLNAETKKYEQFSSSTNDNLTTDVNEKTTTVYALYKVKTNVKAMVEYSTNGTNFTQDKTGSVATATITGGTATANNTSTKTDVVVDKDSVTVSNSLNNANYKFDGWYIKNGTTYTKVDSTTSTTIDIKSDDVTSEGVVIVARYVPADKVKVDVQIAYLDTVNGTFTEDTYETTSSTTGQITNVDATISGARSKSVVSGSDIASTDFSCNASSNNYAFLGWYDGTDLSTLVASSGDIKLTAPSYTGLTEDKTVYALYVKVPTLTFKHIAKSGDESKADSLGISNLKIYKGTSDTPTLSLTTDSSTTSVNTDGVSIELPKSTTGLKDIIVDMYKGTTYKFTVDVQATPKTGNYVGDTTYESTIVVDRLDKSTGDTTYQTINQKLTLGANDNTYTFITPFTEAGKVTLKVIAMTDENNGEGYKEGQVNNYGVTSKQTVSINDATATDYTDAIEVVKGSKVDITSILSNNDKGYYTFEGFSTASDGTGLNITNPKEITSIDADTIIYAYYKLNKPTSGTVQVFFKYYQRKIPDGTPADIDSTATTYESSINITADTTYTEFFGDATNIVNKEIVSLTDTYTLYTDAINDTHKNQYNKDGTDGEKWVTFKTNSSNDYFANNKFNVSANPLDDGITSVTIWLENTPREYSVSMVYPNGLSDLVPLDANKAVGMGKSKTYKAYYNVRLGVKINDTSNADAATNYLIGYGYTNGYLDQALVLPEKELGDYTFSYWSSDMQGKNIVSTDLHYNYRVTKDITLYAIYSKAERPKGVSISSVATDRFVTSTGVNKTRINDVVAVYGFTDDDSNTTYKGIKNIGIVYVKVDDVNTCDVNAIYKYISENKVTFTKDYQKASIIKTNDTFVYYYNVYDSPSYGTPYYDTSAADNGQIKLTNKNRVQLSFDANTTKFNEGAAYSNMLVFAVAVVDNDNDYYVSDSYVSYKNGEPTDKTI